MFAKISCVAAGIVLLLGSHAHGDWHCRCGTIVHVNYPTTCPTCNRSLPESTPPFTPPGGQTDGTGLRLGVAVYENRGQLVVSRVLPDSPAQGLLFQNDRITKGAFRDVATGDVHRFQIASIQDLAQLKTLAGANTEVALEVYRPTTGVRAFLVTFVPEQEGPMIVMSTADGIAQNSANSQANTKYRTVLREDKDGRAKGMLNERSGGSANTGSSGSQSIRQSKQRDSAESLLNGPGN